MPRQYSRSVLKNYTKKNLENEKNRLRDSHSVTQHNRVPTKRNASSSKDVMRRRQEIRERAADPRVVAPKPKIWISKCDRFTIPAVSQNSNIHSQIRARSVVLHTMVLRDLKDKIIERMAVDEDDRVEILSN